MAVIRLVANSTRQSLLRSVPCCPRWKFNWSNRAVIKMEYMAVPKSPVSICSL